MDYINWLHFGRLVGVFFIREYVSYRFNPVRSEKLDFYDLDGIIGEMGLLLAGWEGWTIWDRGGMEGPV